LAAQVLLPTRSSPLRAMAPTPPWMVLLALVTNAMGARKVVNEQASRGLSQMPSSDCSLGLGKYWSPQTHQPNVTAAACEEACASKSSCSTFTSYKRFDTCKFGEEGAVLKDSRWPDARACTRNFHCHAGHYWHGHTTQPNVTAAACDRACASSSSCLTFTSYKHSDTCKFGNVGAELKSSMHPNARACEWTGQVAWEYHGCFEDNHDRFLDELALNSSVTPEGCGAACSNNTFFGLQASHYCFCGNGPRLGHRMNESDCSQTCDGDSSKMCGGQWRNSIYRKVKPLWRVR